MQSFVLSFVKKRDLSHPCPVYHMDYSLLKGLEVSRFSLQQWLCQHRLSHHILREKLFYFFLLTLFFFFFAVCLVFPFYLMQVVFTNVCKSCKFSNQTFITAMILFYKMKDNLLMI